MIRYIVKRLIWMIPITLGITILIFTLMYFVPSDPAEIILGSSATEEELEIMREALGLHDPYLVRLGNYVSQLFLHGDLGTSYISRSAISQELLSRIPRTLALALTSMILSFVFGTLLGVVAAIHQNRWQDRVCMLCALVGVSMPSFWLALLLILLFAVKLNWLPASGIGGIEYYVLPATASAVGGIANLARQTRSSMLEVIRSDYITTARSKGLKENEITYKHALPNALIPIITVTGSHFGHLLGGSLVLETIFGIPGIGIYMVTGINNRDYPVVQACVILLGIVFSICMLLVDIAYAYADPRIKAQYEGGSKRRKKA